MKAWLLDRIGDGVGKLHLAETAEAHASDGEVVLRVLAAALNPADRLLAEGQYPARPPLPHILGRDGVGVIESVGGGLDENLIGDRRVILPSAIGADRNGTFAERVAVPYAWTAAPPADWTIEQSAAAPLTYLTAWQALTQWGDIPPGVVLVTGASGGVGVASLQLAKSLGHTVVAFSRNPAKARALEAAGANFVIDPQTTNLTKHVLAKTGRRIDLAVDSIGGSSLNSVIDCMADRGRISIVGRLGGPVPEFNTASLLFRRVRIGGVIVTGYTIEERQSVWSKVVQSLATANLRPLVDSTFAFQDLPNAFARVAEGPMGKVVLAVSPASPGT